MNNLFPLKWSSIGIGLLVCLAPTPANANLVTNGGFEDPALPIEHGWALFNAGESLSGWTVGTGNIDVVRWGPIGSGTLGPSGSTGYDSFTAAQGYQSIDLNGFGPGSIYQDVTTIPGQTYYLSFAMAGNVVGGPLIVKMDFMWRDNVVDTLTFDVGLHDGYNMGWTYYQYQVTAPVDTGTTRLNFQSLSDTTGARGPALDDVLLDHSPRAGIPILPSPSGGDPSPVTDSGSTMALCLLGLAAVTHVKARSVTNSAAGSARALIG